MDVTTYFQETHTCVENSCIDFYKSQSVLLLVQDFIADRKTDGESD